MNSQEQNDIIKSLLSAGWTPQEIDERLQRVRQRHQQNPDEADQRHPDDLLAEYRLGFVRWLYLTGKLSDSLPDAHSS